MFSASTEGLSQKIMQNELSHYFLLEVRMMVILCELFHDPCTYSRSSDKSFSIFPPSNSDLCWSVVISHIEYSSWMRTRRLYENDKIQVDSSCWLHRRKIKLLNIKVSLNLQRLKSRQRDYITLNVNHISHSFCHHFHISLIDLPCTAYTYVHRVGSEQYVQIFIHV